MREINEQILKFNLPKILPSVAIRLVKLSITDVN